HGSPLTVAGGGNFLTSETFFWIPLSICTDNFSLGMTQNPEISDCTVCSAAHKETKPALN
ncbi:hypothetical protein AVEN_140078-1, partial [Araneus ventricosus]